MLTFALAFLAGDYYLQSFAELPTKKFIIILTGLIISLAMVRRNKLHFIICYGFLFGFLYTAWQANNFLIKKLPKDLEGKSVLVEGEIASIPVKKYKAENFDFAISKIENNNNNFLVHLSWRNAEKQIKVGDKWKLLVKLKRIHATQNPGAFDYEAWVLQKHLSASGFVVSYAKQELIAHQVWKYPVDRFRQLLQNKLQIYLPKTETAEWMLALMIGERNNIVDKQWLVLRNTGTNHLMVIGGLHIGMVASSFYALVFLCCRWFPALMLFRPAQEIAKFMAMLIGLLYGALAGFSLPTKRACLMLIVFSVCGMLRRKISAWSAWALALILVLVLNPFDILSESFVLSFGTIALIIYGMSARLHPEDSIFKKIWWKWGRVQWVIGFGLIPLSLLLFKECSLISFFANCLAIPWLGVMILPLCLLSIPFIFISPNITGFLLWLADKTFALMWAVLTWFSQFHIAAWQQIMPSIWIFLFTVLAFILLLAPIGFPARGLSIIYLLPLLCSQIKKPATKEYWLTILDVGQGLAVIIETKAHTLVYDVGAKYHDNFDMGANIVLPYLRTRTIKKVDMLVISHGDNDHIGGAKSLLSTLPVTSIKTSVPNKFLQAEYCLRNESWQWDGINFSFIYPSKEQLGLGNDSSCVLKIDNGYRSVLLTGDIEKNGEKNLLKSRENLRSDILIVPHHGSKTSGLAAFIKTVQPQYAIFATGYLNRYHFPHPSVIAVYRQLNIMQLNTVDTGAIQFKIQKNALKINSYRVTNKRYWF